MGANKEGRRGLVSPVGGPHSLRGVGSGDGGGREQQRREKNAQVPPVVEAKRGGGRGGSGVDSSPRPAVAFIGASTRYAKNTFDIPPPFFLAARLLEINIQMPWSAAPAVYRTAKVLWEFGTVVRDAMGRLPVRRDVDATGFPRPTAPAPAPARQETTAP